MKILKTFSVATLIAFIYISTIYAGSTGDYPAYTGPKKIAILMLEWQDRGAPATRQTVVDRIWNNSNSLRKYYLDMSRNVLDFVPPTDAAPDGTVPSTTYAVYGPYELSIAAGFHQDVTVANAESLYGGRDLTGTHSVAETLAAADGYDPADYDYVMYVTPKAATTGGLGGYAPVHGTYCHMFDMRQNYINHEIGHNIGLHHSNTSVDQDGYGSQDCVMGNGANPHLDGVHTYNLGWYPDANFSKETYGQYDIENLAQPDTDNVKVLRFSRRIHGAVTKPDYLLWVEYRIKGVGQDIGLHSNWDRKVNVHYCLEASPRPRDVDDYFYYNNNVAWFGVTGSYTDPDNLCTVRFVRENPATASATVQFIKPNGNQPPSIPAQIVGVPPGTTTFNLSVIDPENDDLTYTIVSSPSQGSLTVSGSTFTYSGSVLGSYSFTVRVNDGQYDSFDATIPLTVAGTGLPTVDAGLDQAVALPDPSDTNPGLLYGEVSGNIDVTTPNPATSQITNVAAMTENSIAGNTTEIYTGQIFDADGAISFTEQIDDRTRIWIDGLLVLTSDYHGDRVSTANLALTPGWHDIEIRISNGAGGSGPVNSPGIGFDPAGGTTWQTLVDPGDGSFLRAYNPLAQVSLSGTVSDPDGDSLQSSWSVVGGPGPVNFVDDSSVTTVATFSVQGTYTLRLTTTDGLNTATDDITINVIGRNGPEIDIMGNGLEVSNGDTTPSPADGTSFGTVTVGSTVFRTFTIANSGDSDLILSSTPFVTISGSSAFTVTSQPSSPISSTALPAPSLGTSDFTISFSPSNAEVQTAVVTVSSNDSDEPTYTFTVAGNIPTVSVSATDASANELGPDSGTWTVTRTGGTASALTVYFSLSGTALESTDYTISSTGQVTIPAGQSSATIVLTPVNDSYIELPEAAVLTISDDPSYIVSMASASISISEPDDVRVLSPNGGEWFLQHLNYTIGWESFAGGTVKIDLYKDGVYHSEIVASTVNDGIYDWTGPSAVPVGYGYRVRVTLLQAGGVYDESDAGFSVVNSDLAAAVDAHSLVWSTVGDGDWFYQTDTTNDGVDAAQSPNLEANNESASLETTVTGPGVLTFWWRALCNPGEHSLKLLVNGSKYDEETGYRNWVQKVIVIPPGTNTIKWETSFVPNATYTMSPTAWVDQVAFSPAPPNTYRVDYLGNTSDGGSAPVDLNWYNAGDSVTVYGNTGGLYRNGYAFTGWNTAADGTGDSYAPNDTLTIVADTTLYAQWLLTVPSITLSVDKQEIQEAGETATVTATLSSAAEYDHYIYLSLNGTASPSDYSILPLFEAYIVIYAGSTTGTMTLTSINDTLVEGDETIIIEISWAGGAVELVDQMVTTTIIDDDSNSTIRDTALPAGISLIGYTGANPIDAQAAFQGLIDANQLSLVRWVNPATGQIKELYYTTFPAPAWINEIGNLTLGQGYVVKTSQACTLSISGNKDTSSVTHNLPAGYSIIGFNKETPVDAVTAFQSLITAGKLELVRWVDPSNGSIKELYYTTFPSAGWVNEIGNLTEGQGYIIKLNAPHSGFQLP